MNRMKLMKIDVIRISMQIDKKLYNSMEIGAIDANRCKSLQVDTN